MVFIRSIIGCIIRCCLLFPVNSELFRLRVPPLPALSAATMPNNLDISRFLEIRAEFGSWIRFRPGPRVEAVSH